MRFATFLCGEGEGGGVTYFPLCERKLIGHVNNSRKSLSGHFKNDPKITPPPPPPFVMLVMFLLAVRASDLIFLSELY